MKICARVLSLGNPDPIEHRNRCNLERPYTAAYANYAQFSYIMAKLLQIWFYDAESGEILAKLSAKM